MTVHCLFEQSGTFKNEFKKFGIEAYDYDILDDFGETDRVVDLFSEIRGGYVGEPSLFDTITESDLIMAFFPCTRFEDQIVMGFQGCLNQMKNWTDEKRLEYDLRLHEELSELYELITKMALIAIKRGLPMIIENPAGTQHYLTRYWGIKPTIVDKNRLLRGDYYKKPTQYWFINCEPQHNFIFEPMTYHEGRKSIECTHDKVERSMISKEYANRFIREQILQEPYKAGRKTENSSEKPNNCEHITEDGVTCARYPACDDCPDNPLNKVKGSERLVKGSEQTEPTISKMEQVDEDINVRSKERSE